MSRTTERPLTGWGNTAPSPATVVRVDDADELAHALSFAGPRGLIARGLGRSYGDPAQNAGGVVIDTTLVTGIRDLDPRTGVVTAAAGTSLDDLMRWLVPQGWFVPVTPGTRQVTVGGAVASDIHGKNHHRAGSWCNAVTSFRLLTPRQGIVTVTPESDPDLFWATAGGMGLTGVLLDVSFRLTPIETSLLSVDTDRTPDLDTTIALMESGDQHYPYSVAWIDLVARGAAMGRSILGRGRFAPLAQLDARQQQDPLTWHTRQLGTAPRHLPGHLINPLTIRAFNEVWYRKAPRRERDRLQTISDFFHPLDLVDNWNRFYGDTGIIQWQCAVPLDAVDDLRWIVHELSATGCPSFLAVLKRFGPGNPGMLSFPIEGWTLALDTPAAGNPALGPLLDRLDERVAAAGGRLYLAKDSRMRPELLPAMYPQLDRWRAVRDRVDPDHHIASDLGRRLGLV